MATAATYRLPRCRYRRRACSSGLTARAAPEVQPEHKMMATMTRQPGHSPRGRIAVRSSCLLLAVVVFALAPAAGADDKKPGKSAVDKAARAGKADAAKVDATDKDKDAKDAKDDKDDK